MVDPREHIVILGGGVAGCAAAYWLTDTAELRSKYRVTLYQNGWRLGGKGASSRNIDHQFRSEEHGPHVWFGFYENAFRTLRGCMEEHREAGFTLGDRTNWQDLFEPSREGVFYQKDAQGNWQPWKLELERYPGEPGDDHTPVDTREMLWRVADLLAENLSEAAILGPWQERVLGWFSRILGRQFPVSQPQQCKHAINPGDPNGIASQLSRWLVTTAGSERVWYGEWVVGRLLKWFLALLGWQVRRVAKRPNLSTAQQRELSIIDLCRTCLQGTLVDILLRDKTFSQLDSIEFLTWLKSHGMAYQTLDQSPFLRGYYDTPFAFSGGRAHDPTAADFSAGAALRGFLRIFFGYRGPYLRRMTLGMGECVFVPLYRVLKERGVNFEFFHRVEHLAPNEMGNEIEHIRLNRQARLKPNSQNYEPLIEAPSLDASGNTLHWPAWPDRPKSELLDATSLPPSSDPGFESNWSQHPGETHSIYHRKSKSADASGATHFDHVILALPPATHTRVAADLLAHSRRFATMVKTSESIRTLACQFWITGSDSGPDGLGWDAHGNFCEHALAGAAPDPLNVILEATPILKTEATTGAHHLIYLCGPAINDPDEASQSGNPAYPATQKAAAKKQCLQWLFTHAHLWPKICEADGKTFNPLNLYHPDPNADGQARLDWQYFRINIEPSERYVLSTQISTSHRLAPWDTGFNNLVFAGDWCRNAIDISCVESAVTSGMLASHHLCGHPKREHIAGLEFE